MDTSVGRLLLNDALPEDLRNEDRVLDSKGVQELMREVAERYPDRYKDVLKKLNDIGRSSAWDEGTSVDLKSLRTSPAKEKLLAAAKQKIQQIVDDDRIPADKKDDAVVNTLLPLGQDLQNALFEEAKQENNPFYLQLISGARGKKSDYNSLRGADLLTSDHTGKVIPVPIWRSYAQGLDPVEYFAGLYGQRRGMIGTKFAVGDAGFLNKQLVNAAHRLVVTKDAPDATRLPVGLPVHPKDRDNAGAVLAAPITIPGTDKVLAAGTTLTSHMLKDLDSKGVDEILIHSPLTESTPDGGISRFAAGRRDRFGLSKIGDNIGIAAAQSIGEKLSQGMLNSKHTSGVTGTEKINRNGFEYLNRLIQAPESFPEAGPLAPQAGQIKSVEKAPQGGHYIELGDHKLYVHDGLNPTVKPGDTVDEGDDLTDGVPHPIDLVHHRGLGEARRVYTNLLKEALDNSGISTHRRNLEAVVAGLMNWAKVTDHEGIGDHVVDDVVSHNQLTHAYKPRPTATLAPPKQAIGRYLEEPALHYTVGTRVTRKIADHLHRYGIKDVHTHEEAPGFAPHMQRGLLGVHEDPDWQTQLAGFYTTSAFQKSVARGAESDPNSTSFVPALARGVNFGDSLAQTGHYGKKPPGTP
jgi:DNA-directed RNA polymerase subunit beta'